LALGLDILNFTQGPRSAPIIQKLGSEEERKVKIQNHSFIKNLKKIFQSFASVKMVPSNLKKAEKN